LKARDAYRELIERSREVALLSSSASLLNWDELTYMPAGGVVHRGNQLACLAGIHHEKATHPRIGELLGVLEGSDLVRDPESDAAANVRELRRVYARVSRLPRQLVQDLARAASVGQKAWHRARQKNDYSQFQPSLEEILRLKRAEAECLRDGGSLYDALLEEYEPGARTGDLARLFDGLRREVTPLVAAIRASGRRTSTAVLHRDYPIDRQRVFVEAVADALGFDFRRGRLDSTAHPFSTVIGPEDCRITTRFSATDFGEAFFPTLHEVGHGLYDQGLERRHYGTPLGEAASLGVHESQSRLWENRIGRSRAFWRHFLPLARQVFHEALEDVEQEDFFLAVNHVEPTVNRVRADEATYDLHILVRFEIEQALIDGALTTAELPQAWNSGYLKHLGLRPESDADGCLQDGHWGGGLVGYFPCYTLGNILAAQLFAKARQEIASLDEEIGRGEFGSLLRWLREKVHRHGRRYAAPELIRRAVGGDLDPGPLVATLREKYSEVYGL
jgi:carboxypeptidase Taq